MATLGYGCLDCRKLRERVIGGVLLTLLTLFVVACHAERHVTVFEHVSIRENAVAVHANGHSDAIITQDGQLSIDSRSINTTPEQRAALASYYASVIALKAAGLSAGAHGVATAAAAIDGVAKAATTGSADAIDAQVDQQAKAVDVDVAAVDRNLAALRASERELAGSLPDFKPYVFLQG